MEKTKILFIILLAIILCHVLYEKETTYSLWGYSYIYEDVNKEKRDEILKGINNDKIYYLLEDEEVKYPFDLPEWFVYVFYGSYFVIGSLIVFTFKKKAA